MTEFGKDMSCTDRPLTGRFVTGARLVAESYFRRLTTPRGTLRGSEEDLNFGFDITAEVGRETSTAALPTKIGNELMKDPRSLSIDVEILESKTDDGVGTKLVVEISAQTTEGPFTLQVAVGEVSASLLGFTEG